MLKFCQIQLFSQIINRIEIYFSHVSALRVVSFWFSSVLWLWLGSNDLIGQCLKLPNPSDIETSPYGKQPLLVQNMRSFAFCALRLVSLSKLSLSSLFDLVDGCC